MLWASKTAINKRVYHSLARRAICVEITNLMVIQILSPTVLRLMSRHLTPVKYVNREKTLSVQYSLVFSHLHDSVIIRNPQIICWGCLGSGTSPCSNILVTITITNYPGSQYLLLLWDHTTLTTTILPPWLTNNNTTSWITSLTRLQGLVLHKKCLSLLSCLSSWGVKHCSLTLLCWERQTVHFLKKSQKDWSKLFWKLS